MNIRILLSLLAFFAFSSSNFVGQTCSPPPIVANARSYNIFSPEQEMILGDLVIERTISDYREMDDATLSAYVDQIAQKLIRHLPQTGLVYHFHIIDLNDTNAFNIPGGHVFLSRKIIAFARNEDELAGVMAHELGHATVHHGAIRTSEELKKILKVTSVTDRKDITNKYNLLIENFRTKTLSESDDHGDDEQLEADRIGLFALAGAGYDPEAFFTLFSRLTESKPKGGGWLSDLFGTSNPDEKRLRESVKATSALPPECREGRSAKPTEDFLNWQASVLLYHASDRKEEIPGLVLKREITPKLSSDISYIDVSADGKVILAQSDYAINVIDRPSASVVLQIPVEGAENAQLSPDNKEVSFTTPDLHYEKWNIAQKKPVEVRELFLRSECFQHAISPDGRYLACIYPTIESTSMSDTLEGLKVGSTNLRIVDTVTGTKLWEKKNFYQLGFFEYVTWLYRSGRDDEHNVSMFRVQFSPDSHHVVFSRTDKYRVNYIGRAGRMLDFDETMTGATGDASFALDLTSMKGIDIGGDLKKVTARSYAFIGPDKIVGATSSKLDTGGVFSFPDGKKLQKLELGAEEVKRTANSNYVVLSPLASGTTGIFDIQRNAIVAAIDRKDLTAWGDMVIFEAADGKVVVRETTYDPTKKVLDGKDVSAIELPSAPISNLDVAEVSDDLKWLMISSDTRGGVWNTESGDRKVFARGFRGGVVDTKGIGVADFPQLGSEKHSLSVMDVTSGKIVAFRELPEMGALQYRQFVVAKSAKKEKNVKDVPGLQFTLTPEEKFGLQTASDASLEIRNWIDDKVVWTREFKGRLPRYSFDGFSGRLIIYWRLGTPQGMARAKELPEIANKVDALGDKADDYLIEVVDSFEGKTVANVLVETGKGSISINRGLSEKNWLALSDDEGRVLIYSMNDGILKQRFFGSNAILNRVNDQVAIENFPGEVSIYDLRNGERTANYKMNGKVAFMRFSQRGDRLFIFSNLQSAYVINTPRTSPGTPAP